MDPSDAARRSAERWMGVAEKLLMARDVEGCKQFVSQALDDDPRATGADDLLAAADALLAAQRRRLPSGIPDPYAVLGLDSALPASRDPDVVHAHYRRRSFLLNRSHPDRPCSLAFADAARLVAEAWAFLSDPLRKASLDSDLVAAVAAKAAAARAPTPSPEKQPPPPPPQPSPQPASSPPARQPRQAATASPPAKRGRPPRAAKPQQPPPEHQQEAEAPNAPPFWTACTSCCHVHQYDRSYEACTVLCPSCRRPFLATAMSTPPPIVPGTDMYYCSWGFFPMGFPGGPAFAGPANSPMQLPPASLGFYPMGPYLPLPAQAGVVEGNVAVQAGLVEGNVAAQAGAVEGNVAAQAGVVEGNVAAQAGVMEGNVAGGVDSEAAVSATETTAAPVAPLPAKPTHVKVGAKKRGRPKGSKNKNVVIEIN
ncbi:uncharacterized protein [Lolium perenne]|uniref:uncharacterized protein n=1 Tax=Lolium perenne TaxID=4522 RepID=UPI0021F52447|nr:uncharacterized protein LOC127323787 isoform X1 [Lolium perenne]XP_051207868.1 uncharacterized protein LOC127323787 isoform X1 [Lolium perenne]